MRNSKSGELAEVLRCNPHSDIEALRAVLPADVPVNDRGSRNATLAFAAEATRYGMPVDTDMREGGHIDNITQMPGGCAALAHMRQTNGAGVSRIGWRAMISVVKCCGDMSEGAQRDAAWEMSKGWTKADAHGLQVADRDVLDREWNQVAQPTGCEKFSTEPAFADICAGCKVRGAVARGTRSHITLGPIDLCRAPRVRTDPAASAPAAPTPAAPAPAPVGWVPFEDAPLVVPAEPSDLPLGEVSGLPHGYLHVACRQASGVYAPETHRELSKPELLVKLKELQSAGLTDITSVEQLPDVYKTEKVLEGLWLGDAVVDADDGFGIWLRRLAGTTLAGVSAKHYDAQEHPGMIVYAAEMSAQHPKWAVSLSKLGGVVNGQNKARVQRFLLASMSKLKEDARGKEIRATPEYGWLRDDKGAPTWVWSGRDLVHAATQIPKQRDKNQRPVITTPENMAAAARQWATTVEELVEVGCEGSSDLPHRRMLLALGLASPIYTMPGTGNTGGVVAVHGPAGLGKSAMIRMAACALAAPEQVNVGGNSTVHSLPNMQSVLRDIALWIDDAPPAFMTMGPMQTFIMQSTSGRGRNRLDSETYTTRTPDRWSAFAFATANSTLDEWLPESGQREAAHRRVLRLVLDQKPKLLVDKSVDKMVADVGGALADWWPALLRERQPSLPTRYAHWRKQVIEKSGADVRLAVPIALLASALTAAEIAHSVGLLAFGPDDLMVTAIELMHDAAERVRMAADVLLQWSAVLEALKPSACTVAGTGLDQERLRPGPLAPIPGREAFPISIYLADVAQEDGRYRMYVCTAAVAKAIARDPALTLPTNAVRVQIAAYARDGRIGQRKYAYMLDLTAEQAFNVMPVNDTPPATAPTEKQR
jgi:ABC-type uncharacterized transport system YnjBCD ATPase subunit